MAKYVSKYSVQHFLGMGFAALMEGSNCDNRVNLFLLQHGNLGSSPVRPATRQPSCWRVFFFGLVVFWNPLAGFLYLICAILILEDE